MEFLSNKWVEMKSLIKHVFFIYIAINITPNIYGQELIESINNSYKLLDTALYIDDIKKHVLFESRTISKSPCSTRVLRILAYGNGKSAFIKIKRSSIILNENISSDRISFEKSVLTVFSTINEFSCSESPTKSRVSSVSAIRLSALLIKPKEKQ